MLPSLANLALPSIFFASAEAATAYLAEHGFNDAGEDWNYSPVSHGERFTIECRDEDGLVVGML